MKGYLVIARFIRFKPQSGAKKQPRKVTEIFIKKMMGPEGLKKVSEVAILNANYLVSKLEPQFEVLYKGEKGRVAHECIIDLRHLKKSCGIDVTDIAKRLMDFGFHAPTVSFPVPETLMIEPTESEDVEELDRFCEAMLKIKSELDKVVRKEVEPKDSVLRMAPHTAEVLTLTVLLTI